jgi:hypothetical protein
VAAWWFASRDATSRRKSESPWQASRSQALRSAGSRSSASWKSDSICSSVPCAVLLPSRRHAPLQLVAEVQQERQAVMGRCFASGYRTTAKRLPSGDTTVQMRIEPL